MARLRTDGGTIPVQSDRTAAFDAFVRDRSAALLRAGWLLTGDWAAAEDLVQTALSASWRRWEHIEHPAAAESYVRRTMLTTYLRWQRRRWTGEYPTEQLPEVAGPDAYDGIEMRGALLGALATLSPQQRAVVVLRFFLDLSEADTAAALDCSAGSVKTHASRALARLRACPGLDRVLDGGE